MSDAFAGRVALVTGAGSGIGRAITLLFAQRGARVVAADIDGAAARATAEAVTGDALALSVDVADEQAVAAMLAATVDRFGGLDCACNNAGISPLPRPFVEHTPADWQRVIDVNLSGVFWCMQHEVRQFLAQGRAGTIVNVASGAAVVAAPGQPQYTAAKHGVLGLTKQAAQEYARSGVRVNAILPGQTDTPPMRAYVDAQPDLGERMTKALPMGRMAMPVEIAQAAVWLCSDDAAYVNGASLLVDGGLIAR
ncbi:MAG: SDR family NAD(P)-dependent oxidoreductase [Actinomycetota bacterium]